MLNGVTSQGEVAAADADTKKDFLVTDQFLIDDAGSGVQAMGYYGTVVGLDTLAPGLTSHFWRVGLTANKIYRDFDLLVKLPQYLRWAVEYRLDSPQGGAPKTNNVVTEFRLNF